MGWKISQRGRRICKRVFIPCLFHLYCCEIIGLNRWQTLHQGLVDNKQVCYVYSAPNQF